MSEYNKQPLYVHIARAIDALARCRSDDANESQQAWESRWEDYISRAAQCLPCGGGFDVHPTIDTDNIKPDRIVITGSYHNMNSDGYYCGWSDYRIIVRPSLVSGFTLSISGGDADFKDYAVECFDVALHEIHDTLEFHDEEIKARHAAK